jgi:hypothetical protein
VPYNVSAPGGADREYSPLVAGSRSTVGRGILLSMLVCALAGPVACGSRPPPDAVVAVDQVGYTAHEIKTAMLLAPRDATGARATVVDDHGKTVATPAIGPSRGAWNSRFRYVHPVDMSALTRPGTYRIRVEGAVTAQSPPFRVGSGAALFDPLVANALTYFQAHRDGADQLPGPWRRAPAHLADRAATVYRPPSYDNDGRMTEAMTSAAGPVDVEGGWYDAGDFLKFTHTTAYALIAMLLVQRDGPAPAGLAAETRHGLDWLDKMWDEDTGTLYTQVGIGSGLDTADGGFLGDHDTWRLPQADDQLKVEPGDDHYYQRYRPVFRAAEPGDALSPNLAGRVAAAYALAAQVNAATDPTLAGRYLDRAARIFALADTAGPGELVTAQPRSFYPEDSWADDLATGATQLALAGTLLQDPRATDWARQATHWAKVNADNAGTDSLSVYDLSVVADAELDRLLTATPVADAEISTDGLRDDLRRRLDAGVAAAAADPLGAAAGSGGSDYAARQLGYAVTAALYQRMSGDNRYAAFGTAQRGVALGANGWGTSLVIGAGTIYPRCPHDQIASLTSPGGALSMIGAVVNGPNTATRIHELLPQTTASPCAAGQFKIYDRADADYVDDVRVSANSEPSIDFTATGMLAFALTAGEH